jgi:DNA modification methylase
MNIKPIHPFPARMAPEIAFIETASLAPNSLVLDSMAGSGTSVRIASQQGHRAIAHDMDPLAVLMTKVWTTPINTSKLRIKASDIATRARALRSNATDLPWIDADKETGEFIDFWFDTPQRDDLRKISSLLVGDNRPLANAIRIALSRLIITKKRGASLAWDVSHSRPHKKRDTNDFQVIPEFLKSVEYVAKRLEDQPPPGNVRVSIADARELRNIEDGSVDAVLTSPPYLNAIDYMRGHKMALIWFGHKISNLRVTRGANVGSTRKPDADANAELAEILCEVLPAFDQLPDKEKGIVKRYALDMHAVISEIHRALRPQGKAVFVIGNSCLKDVFIQNSLLITTAAQRVGLELVRERERDLPPSRRYLPPPAEGGQADLNKRMRTESILTFIKP